MKALLLLAYRHGLRASEVCDLQWHQVDLTAGRLHVQVAMSYGLLAASNVSSAALILRARGPMTAKSFHTLIARLGERAGMAFPIHPHMLRHGCGYALANAGHDTRSIQAGQVRELLDFLALTSSFEGFATRPTAASYS